MFVDYVIIPSKRFNDDDNYCTIYRLNVDDRDAYFVNEYHDIVIAIKLGENISGVSSYSKMFEGYSNIESWFGTYYKDDDDDDDTIIVYDGEFVFSSNNDSICDNLSHFKGKKYICQKGSESYFEESGDYSVVEITDNMLTGFVITYKDYEFYDAVYYIDNAPACRFFDSQNNRIISSESELREIEFVDIDFICSYRKCNTHAEHVYKSTPVTVQSESYLSFCGKVYKGKELIYTGEFYITLLGNFIRHGAGKREITKQGTVLSESGIWVNNVLRDGYGLIDNIYSAVTNFSIDTYTSNYFSSIFFLENDYRVVDIKFVSSTILEGTLKQGDKVLGYGRFNHKYLHLEQSLEFLIAEIDSNFVTATIPTEETFLSDIILTKNAGGTCLKTSNITVLDKGYYPEINKDLSVDAVIKLIDQIFEDQFYVKIPDGQMKVLSYVNRSILDIFKVQRLDVFGIAVYTDGREEYGEYTFDLYTGEMVTLYSYRELRDGYYKVINSGFDTFYDIKNDRAEIGKLSITFNRNRNRASTDITKIYSEFLEDMFNNIKSLDVGECHFQGDVKMKESEYSCDESESICWIVDGILYRSNFRCEGSFTVYPDGIYYIEDAWGMSKDGQVVEYIHNNKEFIVDRLTHIITCKLHGKVTQLYYTGDINPITSSDLKSLEVFFKINILDCVSGLIGDMYIGNGMYIETTFRPATGITSNLEVKSMYINGEYTSVLFIDDNYIYIFDTDKGEAIDLDTFRNYEGMGTLSRIDPKDPNYKKEKCIEGYFCFSEYDCYLTVYSNMLQQSPTLFKYISEYNNIDSIIITAGRDKLIHRIKANLDDGTTVDIDLKTVTETLETDDNFLPNIDGVCQELMVGFNHTVSINPISMSLSATTITYPTEKKTSIAKFDETGGDM